MSCYYFKQSVFVYTGIFFSCMKLSYEKVVYVDDQLSRGE
ncbi:hypothetical protein BSSX_1982 [Bacillus subtilis]|nr:hypothetical protein BSSX_1982 [Bacillus subtilis]